MITHILTVSEEELKIVENHVDLKNCANENIDYGKTICKKPWGYEFLVYSSDKIAIWFLKINAGQATSLHTHFRKDTFITVLDGCAELALIDGKYALQVSDSVFIPRHKFYGIGSYSPSCYLLEIEIFQTGLNFSDKNDLLRINDLYHRSSTGYEASIIADKTAESLVAHDYFELSDGLVKQISGTCLKVSKSYTPANYNILLNGTAFQEGAYLSPGSQIKSSAQVEGIVLSISNPFYFEDAKLVYSQAHLKTLLQQLRANADPLTLTSGCYDIVHVGHLQTLRAAKNLGGKLMVCLSSDAQIRALKGESRPINKLQDRIDLFKTISYVDYIILYDEANIATEETLGEIIRLVNPTQWVKGSDYTKSAILAKHPYIKNIVLFENLKDKSTTNIVQTIMSPKLIV